MAIFTDGGSRYLAIGRNPIAVGNRQPRDLGQQAREVAQVGDQGRFEMVRRSDVLADLLLCATLSVNVRDYVSGGKGAESKPRVFTFHERSAVSPSVWPQA